MLPQFRLVPGGIFLSGDGEPPGRPDSVHMYSALCWRNLCSHNADHTLVSDGAALLRPERRLLRLDITGFRAEFQADWNRPPTAPVLVAIRSEDGKRIPKVMPDLGGRSAVTARGYRRLASKR